MPVTLPDNNIHEKITRFWLAEKGVQKRVTRVQKKCNTSAKSVIPVQITHRNSGLWLADKQYGFWKNQSNLLLSNQARALDGAILWRNFSLIAWYACVSSAWPSRIFSCMLSISNHMIFLVQFEINRHLKIFFQDYKFWSSLKKFTRAYLFQIALEIMWLPILTAHTVRQHARQNGLPSETKHVVNGNDVIRPWIIIRRAQICVDERSKILECDRIMKAFFVERKKCNFIY